MDDILYAGAIDTVYEEFVRKLCNIRIEEFMSTTRKKFASDKGNALNASHIFTIKNLII